MLSWNDVIYYVRGRLALPSSFLEDTDEEIKKWVKMTALREFSEYIPSIAWTPVHPQDPTHITEIENVYKFWDEEELPIYGVRNFYFDATGDFATGHPIIPPMSFDSIKNFALDAFKASLLKPYSLWGFTCKYIRPNKIRVLPTINYTFVVEYEREQPEDLRQLPSEHSRAFLDLALAEMMIKIGGIRTSYENISSPFGDIPLRGETLKSDGMELKREVVERLREISIPGVIVQIG